MYITYDLQSVENIFLPCFAWEGVHPSHTLPLAWPYGYAHRWYTNLVLDRPSHRKSSSYVYYEFLDNREVKLHIRSYACIACGADQKLVCVRIHSEDLYPLYQLHHINNNIATLLWLLQWISKHKLAVMLCLTSYSISYILIYFTLNHRYLYVLIVWSRWGSTGNRMGVGWTGV